MGSDILTNETKELCVRTGVPEDIIRNVQTKYLEEPRGISKPSQRHLNTSLNKVISAIHENENTRGFLMKVGAVINPNTPHDVEPKDLYEITGSQVLEAAKYIKLNSLGGWYILRSVLKAQFIQMRGGGWLCVTLNDRYRFSMVSCNSGWLYWDHGVKREKKVKRKR